MQHEGFASDFRDITRERGQTIISFFSAMAAGFFGGAVGAAFKGEGQLFRVYMCEMVCMSLRFNLTSFLDFGLLDCEFLFGVGSLLEQLLLHHFV